MTPIAAPWNRASTHSRFWMKRDGDVRGDLAPSVRCRRPNPARVGVDGLELVERAGRLRPVYFRTRFEPPEKLRWSRRYTASSTNVCGPCGRTGAGYFRSSCKATE